MVNRTTFSGASTPPLGGPDFLNQYAERIGTLFDASALPLTGVGGTADAVTATLDPPLAVAGTFVDGMKFTLTWAATNTAGVTLAINGGTALPVLDKFGSALNPDALVSGMRSLIEYVGGAFRLLTEVRPSNAQSRFWQLTTSGSWDKPAGLDDDQIITIEAWGAGAGGASGSAGGGGGGGGYVKRRMRAADVPSTVSYVIGAGGAVGVSGGNTNFGSLVTAYGGMPGGGSTNGSGGGGGGELEKGGAGASGGGSAGGAGGSVGGGAGGTAGATDGSQNGKDAETVWGGGGGGATGTPAGRGGRSVFGGGGGGGGTNGSAGVSLFGGNGGAANAPGAAPGGAGGRNQNGARGEIRISIA